MGQQYKIQDISFEPSLAEKGKALAELRQDVYDQVKSELEKLNSTFSNDHYFLHSIDFAYPLPFAGQNLMKMERSEAVILAAVPIGKEVTLIANVTFAARVRNK